MMKKYKVYVDWDHSGNFELWEQFARESIATETAEFICDENNVDTAVGTNTSFSIIKARGRSRRK